MSEFCYFIFLYFAR